MKDEILNSTAKMPRITGSTTINHSLRFEMGLGPMEYVLMEAIVEFVSKIKPVTDVAMFTRTGLVPDEQIMTLHSLVKKGFIYPAAKADGSPNITPKWSSFFKSVEEEFIDFWKKDGTNCWPGSKPQALKLYIQARKKHPKTFILHQRDEYFRYLDLVHKNGFDRPKMMATVFLGPKDRLQENWTAYAKDEERKMKRDQEFQQPESSSILTKEERLKKYEDKGS